MKNFVLIFGLIVLLCGGCKYFKKSSKSVETITADTSADTTVVDSSAYYNESQPVVTDNYSAAGTVANAVNGTYYMIVGCFTISANADRYAEMLRSKGFAPQIIQGNNNFQMVSARTYNSYRESVSEIEKFRNEVTPNAWVYLQR